MKPKIYYINRYSSPKQKNVKNFSGYEQVVKYSELFRPVRNNKLISKLIFKLSKIKKPKDYRASKSSEEVLMFFRAFITGKPVFYLYADKDAFLLPLLKRKFKLNRIKLFGTLHWPVEISQDFSYYKYNLSTEFNGIITLSSSLNSMAKTSCVIPHGINTTYWKNESLLSYQNTYLILGISNRNHPGQIAIVAKIKQMDPAAKFILLMQDQEVYKQYALHPEIEIRNTRVSDADLKDLYTKSKAVILIQNYCLASNVVLECISMKTPLLVNRVGDIEEYLGKDYPLYLDEAQEAEKLNSICHTPEFREEVVNHLSQIRDAFEWQAIADKTVEFIENGCK